MSAIEKTVPDAPEQETQGQEVTRQTDRYVLPPVDIYDEGQTLVVLADLPGVDKAGLSVQVEQGILTIEGRVPQESTRACLRREFSLTSFFRQFRITEAIDTESIRASLRNGVLRLEMPKAEAAKPRKIPLEA